MIKVVEECCRLKDFSSISGICTSAVLWAGTKKGEFSEVKQFRYFGSVFSVVSHEYVAGAFNESVPVAANTANSSVILHLTDE